MHRADVARCPTGRPEPIAAVQYVPVKKGGCNEGSSGRRAPRISSGSGACRRPSDGRSQGDLPSPARRRSALRPPRQRAPFNEPLCWRLPARRAHRPPPALAHRARPLARVPRTDYTGRRCWSLADTRTERTPARYWCPPGAPLSRPAGRFPDPGCSLPARRYLCSLISRCVRHGDPALRTLECVDLASRVLAIPRKRAPTTTGRLPDTSGNGRHSWQAMTVPPTADGGTIPCC